MKLMKKLTALLLALVLCLSAAAFAAGEDLAGLYTASTVIYEGSEFPASMFFDSFTLELYSDSTAVFALEGESMPYTWETDGSSVFFKGDDEMTLAYENGKLLFDQEGVVFVFEKESAATPASAASRVTSVLGGAPAVSEPAAPAADTVSLPALTGTEKAGATTVTVELSDALKELLGDEFDTYKMIADSSSLRMNIAFAGTTPVIAWKLDLAGSTMLNGVFSLRNGALYYTDLNSNKTTGIAIIPEQAAGGLGLGGIKKPELYVPDTDALMSELMPIAMGFLYSGDAAIGNEEKTITLDGANHDVTEYYVSVGPKAGAALFSAIAEDLKEGTELNKIVSAYLGSFGLTPEKLAAACASLAGDLETKTGALKLSADLEGGIPVLASAECGEFKAGFRLVSTDNGVKGILELPGDTVVTAELATDTGSFRLTAEEAGNALFTAFFEKDGTDTRAGLAFPEADLTIDFVSAGTAGMTNATVTFTNAGNVSTLVITKTSGSLNAVYTNTPAEINGLLTATKADKAVMVSASLTADGETGTFNYRADEAHWHADTAIPEAFTLGFDMEKSDDAYTGSLLCTTDDDLEISYGWKLGTEKSRFGNLPGSMTIKARDTYFNECIANAAILLTTEADADTLRIVLNEIDGENLGGSAVVIRYEDGSPVTAPAAEAVMTGDINEFVTAIFGNLLSLAA